MRRTIVALALVGVLSLAGCRGVIMNAEYSALLDHTAALSLETAARAEGGQLAPADMAQALTSQAVAWQKFQDARDGKDGQ